MNGVPLECLEDSDLYVPEKCASSVVWKIPIYMFRKNVQVLLFGIFRFICSGKMCNSVVWKIPIYIIQL
jgi:hypothetical protein